MGKLSRWLTGKKTKETETKKVKSPLTRKEDGQAILPNDLKPDSGPLSQTQNPSAGPIADALGSNRAPSSSSPRPPTAEVPPSPVLQNQFTSKKPTAEQVPIARLPTNFPILNLLPELILDVAHNLDYSTAVLLSLSCKKLHDIIPIPQQAPDWPQKRTMLQNYPSIRTFAGDRSPPHLCEDCQMWHTFEHMVLWPNPQSENRFNSYIDFKHRGERVCIRYAAKNPQLQIKGAFWIPGQALDSKYFLCKDCNTPSKYTSSNKAYNTIYGKRCQWNCGMCGRCAGRKSWSAYCDRCWRPGYSTKMWNDEYEYQPLQLSLVDESKKKTCGICLGVLSYSAGSQEMCRCTESRHNSTTQMWYE